MTPLEYAKEVPDIPYIDYGEEGPFRCYRCKAYVNPYMTFVEGGIKSVCNLCSYINEVPINY
jgi:protein transport protein SEC24